MVIFKANKDTFAEYVKLIVTICLPGLASSVTKNVFACYSCSYIQTDPPLHYECANEPWNVTVGLVKMPCDDSRYCVTKTVYNADRSLITSSYRSCGTPEKFACGENCCQGSIYNYACQYQCQSDACNRADETERIIKKDSDDNKKNGINSSAQNVPCYAFLFAIIFFSLSI